METQFSYRIIKIAGRAVSVAICAFTGMALVANAQAAEVLLGTSYNLTTPGDGSTAAAATYSDGEDRWLLSTANYYWDNADRWRILNSSNPGYAVSLNRSGDLFYDTVVTYWRNDVASQNGSAWTVGSWGDAYFFVDAVRDSQYRSNAFGAIIDSAQNNYSFGLGATVSSELRGSKAYAYVGDFTPDRNFNAYGMAAFVFNPGSASQSNPTGFAVDVAGGVNFAGGNIVNGNARALSFSVTGNNSVFNGSMSATGAVDVNGNDNIFNGIVNADRVNLSGNNTTFADDVTVANGLNFLNGVTASLTNGAYVSGNVNFGANDATLRLSDSSGISGNVTAIGVNGSLVFEGAGEVFGTVGATNAQASLKEIRLNGADTVNLNNSTQAAVVNYVNYQAAATLTARGGLALNQGSVQNKVAFNQHDGTLQVAGHLLGVLGQDVVTTTGNNIGTVTMVGGGQSVVGNIGAAGHAIKTLNIGGNGVSLFSVDNAASTTSMSGHVYAQDIVLRNTNSASSELRMVSGYNLTGAVTTADPGKGVLTLMGGTQSVNGHIGEAGTQLAAVNAGATSGNATLNGNVFATHLNVTGTGTVNLNGNFTGSAIQYIGDGTLNLAHNQYIHGAVLNRTNTPGKGVLTFVQDGFMASNFDIGDSAQNNLKLVNVGDVNGTEPGTVTTNTIWATTTAINNGSTLHVRSGKNINGAVSTETTNTGTLDMMGGSQNVTGQVGAANALVGTVNAGTTAGTTTFGDDVYATQLNVVGTGTVNLNGNFTGNSISYADDGIVNLANGKFIQAAVSNDSGTSPNGVLTFVQNGSMAAGHDIGSSTASLRQVNVSDVNGTAGTVTTDTIWATSTAINNGSTLNVRSGKNINGVVTSETANTGTLTLQGGAQTVTGTVGNGARLATVNAGANGATSTFNSSVFATQLNVTGTGAVNLNGNFTGTDIRFQVAGAQGTVNLVNNGTSINSIVTTATNNTGTLTLQAGTQTVTGAVGTDGARLATVNAGANSATSNFNTHVFADRLNVTGNGVVNLGGNFTGTAINYNSNANGTVRLAAGNRIEASVTTGTNDSGTLTMLGGTQSVSGNVGAAGAGLATVNAGVNGAVTTFNGMVHATTLQYTGNGRVLLNGANGGSSTAGLVGTVNFGSGGTGDLQIGDNVNLTTGLAGIQFANANNARMTFNGSSTVTGVLGAAATGNTLANSTLGSIYAGVAGEAVTFKNDVYVSGSTFHVSGTGTVNLEGDLYGPLVYDADGTVNVSNGKSIRNDGTAALGTVTTTVGNGTTGTLNYLGNTTLANDLGAVGAALKAVNFHSSGAVAAVGQTLNKNIYAATTTIGNATTGTTANITANVFLGNSLTLAASNVTINTAQQDVAQVAGGARISGANANTLTFAHTKEADGRLSTSATVTNATTGTGAITTNGATLNFSVAAQPWAANAGGEKAATSAIGGGAGTLVMNGNENVNIALLGSLKNGQTHTLINVGAATTTQTGTATDNSYVIDSVLSRVNGDLVVTFNRDAQSYVSKSATAGHFSQAAATRLGTLAAVGGNYSDDMQRVINKLDLDQWGYGNNQANLATQVKRLAPVSNGSITLSALDAGVLALNTMGNRMASLRADNSLLGIAGAEAEGRDGQWIKLVGNNSKQSAQGAYDGYSARTSGLVWGADTRVNKDTLLGLGLSVTNTSVDQQDFRVGQGSTIRSHELAGYGAYQFNQNIYGEASLSYAHHSITGNRLSAIDRMAKADYDANQLTARLGLGYRFVLAEKQTLTPMLNLESSRLRSDAFTETGADALNLKVNAHTLSRNRSSLGLRYLSESKTDAGTVFRPEFTAEVYSDNKGMSQNVTAAFAGDLTGATFTTNGVETARSGYKLSAGVSILNSKTSLVQLHYGYDHRTGFANHSARIKARWDF